MTSQSQAAAASPATEFRLDKSFYIESESKRAAQPQREREKESQRKITKSKKKNRRIEDGPIKTEKAPQQQPSKHQSNQLLSTLEEVRGNYPLIGTGQRGGVKCTVVLLAALLPLGRH